jgi:hypothetical protein
MCGISISTTSGSSKANTRIESAWSRTRRHGGDYWHATFADLEHNGFIDRNAHTRDMYHWQRQLLQVIVLPLLSNWLTDHLRTWNSHRIRRSHAASVPGKPDELYTAPITPAAFCLQPVSTEWINIARSRVCDAEELATANLWMTVDERCRAEKLVMQYLRSHSIDPITMENWTTVSCAIVQQEPERIIDEATNKYE